MILLEKIPEKDRKFLVMLPLIANWIKRNKYLSEAELRIYQEMYAEQVEIALSIPESKMLEFLGRYHEDAFYGSYVKIILSHEGIERLRGILRQLREFRDKGK